jgi:hypothetical protein
VPIWPSALSGFIGTSFKLNENLESGRWIAWGLYYLNFLRSVGNSSFSLTSAICPRNSVWIIPPATSIYYTSFWSRFLFPNCAATADTLKLVIDLTSWGLHWLLPSWRTGFPKIVVNKDRWVSWFRRYEWSISGAKQSLFEGRDFLVSQTYSERPPFW